MKINNPKKTNIVIRCIFKHPENNLNEFKEFYINNFLDKLKKKDINLLNYYQDASTNEFLDFLSSHFFLPHLLQPTSVRSNSNR